ncbi:MAG: hypothetical protein HRT69_02495 [Flavobacteriaceae bacterium]|nr:hypothetical protein [Flavobacteriaceae bacterium]
MRWLSYIFLITIPLLSCSGDDDSSVSGHHVEWIKTFGGSKNEVANSIVNTQDGGYVVLGYTQSSDGDVTNNPIEGHDYWVLKFNANDELEWNKTYGGSLDDRGNEIIQTQDGGYVIVGYSKSSDEDVTNNAGSHDLWIVKLNASGVISWEKSFGYIGSDKALTVVQTSDNGYFIAGVLDVTASGGAGNSRAVLHSGGDFWGVKLDASGNTQWTKYYGGNLSEIPYDAIQTSDGGFIIVGSSDSIDVDISDNKGLDDFWIVKIDASGTLVWEKSFGGSGIDEAHSIVASNDGNYMIAGETRSNDGDVSQNSGSADVWLIKIDGSGNLLWEKTYGGSSFDVGRSIKKTQDGGYLLAGSSRSQDGDLSTNNGQNDAWVFKVSSNGDKQWEQSLGGSQIDFAYDVIENASNEVILVGESSSSDFDILENKGFSDLLIAKIK